MIKSLSRTAGKLQEDPKSVASRKAKKAAKQATVAAEVAPPAPAAAVAPPAPVPVPEPEPPPPPAVEAEVAVPEPGAEATPPPGRPEKVKRPRYVRPAVERKEPPKPLPPLARSNKLTGKLMSKVVPPLPPDEAGRPGTPGRR